MDLCICNVAQFCNLFISATVCTFGSFQVALHVGEQAFALIFGWNMFVALALQSIMTLVVTDKRGLDLEIHTQVLFASLT